MQKNIGYEHFLYVYIHFVYFFIICEYQDIKIALLAFIQSLTFCCIVPLKNQNKHTSEKNENFNI